MEKSENFVKMWTQHPHFNKTNKIHWFSCWENKNEEYFFTSSSEYEVNIMRLSFELWKSPKPSRLELRTHVKSYLQCLVRVLWCWNGAAVLKNVYTFYNNVQNKKSIKKRVTILNIMSSRLDSKPRYLIRSAYRIFFSFSVLHFTCISAIREHFYAFMFLL